ncbi:hypothetical protein ACFL3V_04770 [Nanoarchaeota archaeon]
MEQAKYDKLKLLIEKVMHAYHTAALKGITPHTTIRGIATSIELKYAEKEEKRIEKELDNLKKDIEKHYVTAAETDEYNIAKYILKMIRNIYRSIFNIMVFEKVELLELEHFVETVLHRSKLPAIVKKDLGDKIVALATDWQKNLRSLQNGANAVFASGKGQKTVSLQLTKMLHTQGASYMKRRQEINGVKDAHRDAATAEDLGRKILKIHFKSKEDAETKVQNFYSTYKRSLEEFEKAVKLIFIDWEEAFQYLREEDATVEKAAAEHELPELDKKQMKELRQVIVNKISESFIHNIREGINQLNTIKGDVESTAQKLQKAA